MGMAQPVVICHRVDTHTHKRMHEISAVPYQPNVYVFRIKPKNLEIIQDGVMLKCLLCVTRPAIYPTAWFESPRSP